MDGHTVILVLAIFAVAVLLTIGGVILVRRWQQRECRIEKWEFDNQRNWYEVTVIWLHVPDRWVVFNLTFDEGNTFAEILFNHGVETTPVGYVFHYKTIPYEYLLGRINQKS